jgi:hypothetical protein
MSGITLEGKLYMLEQDRSFKGDDVVRFLKHLLHQIPGKLLIIWDGSPIHRSRAVKDFLASGRLAGCTWSSCPAKLLISTPMREYGSTSNAWS